MDPYYGMWCCIGGSKTKWVAQDDLFILVIPPAFEGVLVKIMFFIFHFTESVFDIFIASLVVT